MMKFAKKIYAAAIYFQQWIVFVLICRDWSIFFSNTQLDWPLSYDVSESQSDCSINQNNVPLNWVAKQSGDGTGLYQSRR